MGGWTTRVRPRSPQRSGRSGVRARLPSPVQEVEDDRSHRRGLRLLLKRDDLIHPELVGNKWRKLARTWPRWRGAPAHVRRRLLQPPAGQRRAGRLLGVPTIGVVRGQELADRPLNRRRRGARPTGCGWCSWTGPPTGRSDDPQVRARLLRDAPEWHRGGAGGRQQRARGGRLRGARPGAAGPGGRRGGGLRDGRHAGGPRGRSGTGPAGAGVPGAQGRLPRRGRCGGSRTGPSEGRRARGAWTAASTSAASAARRRSWRRSPRTSGAAWARHRAPICRQNAVRAGTPRPGRRLRSGHGAGGGGDGRPGAGCGDRRTGVRGPGAGRFDGVRYGYVNPPPDAPDWTPQTSSHCTYPCAYHE